MSKQVKRKIAVDLSKTKDLSIRPSVFDRLGTKKTSSVKKASEYCRQWAQHGNCAYGKNCKFALTHTLVSPSKQRAANKDSEQKRLIKDDGKGRLLSTVVVRSGRSPNAEIDNWDQNDLECADTDVLEKRRQELQRELELQLKMDTGRDMRKDKKKIVSSSSSSRSSSSSSVSSSSSGGSTSSSSTGRDAKKKIKKNKLKRNSSSSPDSNIPKKKVKSDTNKKVKNDTKKVNPKKDERLSKKIEVNKKESNKGRLRNKSLSPGKKSGGTPPINSKNISRNIVKNIKSPLKKDKNRSVTPRLIKDKVKDRGKEKEREKDKDRDKDRERNRGRSRTPRKVRSRSPRQCGSHLKDPRRKESSERSRPISPKKLVRSDASVDRHRKVSPSRDRDRIRDHKDRSLERRKDKYDDKDRHDRKDRRERIKDVKRDDNKSRSRQHGLGSKSVSDKGLEKPNKPVERLLPRPEERLAALAAITNKVLEIDKNRAVSKERQDSDRGGRKQDRVERERSKKRERIESLERDQADYDHQYERGLSHYDRNDERYDDGPGHSDRSPGYGRQSRDRHYENTFDAPGPARGYLDDEERLYGDHLGDRRGVDIGFDNRRGHRGRSWEGRSVSIERERDYIHPHKEWNNDDYRPGVEWSRDRHWPMHEVPMSEWGDKEQNVEGWHPRSHPSGSQRGRMHDDYGRGRTRVEMGRGNGNKRNQPRNDKEPVARDNSPGTIPVTSTVAPPTHQEPDSNDKPIPDDLSEISDDPDDILNRDDMLDTNLDEDSQTVQGTDEGNFKPESSEKESTQDTSGIAEEKESQGTKDEDDVANMDFEEISDGELEEEKTRAGLGDALGVDWASLVADVNRREQTEPTTGARSHWNPERVLARIGLSVEMAGKDTVQAILDKNAETLNAERNQKNEKVTSAANENETTQPNGDNANLEKRLEVPKDVASLHPVAEIQVAIEKRRRQRAVLFGSGCEITRALSARRDLALRRHLCHLPAAERTGQSRVTPQPSLFHAARALLMQAPISG